MIDIAEENKIIARAALEAFGGKPNVTVYWDEAEQTSVDLLTCKDQPQKGATSYSTIGLSDSPILVDGIDIDVRVEFVGACSNSVAVFKYNYDGRILYHEFKVVLLSRHDFS